MSNRSAHHLWQRRSSVPHVSYFIRSRGSRSDNAAEAIFDVAVPAGHILAVLRQLPDGRAVLIQKPMGDNLNQAREILALCQAKQLTAAINFQMRWAPFIIAARSLIDQGAIGEVHDMEVRVTVYTPWHLWPFFATGALCRNPLPQHPLY